MVEDLGSVVCAPVLLNYCMIWRKIFQYSEPHIPYLSGIVNHETDPIGVTVAQDKKHSVRRRNRW